MVTAELIPPGVDFTQVYTLLTQHQQSNGSLIVPPNHPVLNKILDVLTAQGFEKLADERWNDMTNKVHNTPNVKEGGDEESKEWLQLQRDPYIKYEEMHKLDFNSDDNNEENGKSNNLPNPLSKERFDKLRNAGVAMNKWEQRLNELRQYYEEKGDCDVPVNHPGVSFPISSVTCFERKWKSEIFTYDIHLRIIWVGFGFVGSLTTSSLQI